MGSVGVVGACALGLVLAGFVRSRGHAAATTVPAPPPAAAPAGDTPWGLIVVAVIVLVGLAAGAVFVFRRLRRPAVVQRWARADAIEAAEPQPAIEARTWHYILDGRTADSGWVELGRGYVDWPAADYREMAAEVVRRALERQPDGTYRARVTPAERQETPR